MNMRYNDLPIRSLGFCLAALGGLLMAVNGVRAFVDPAAFAIYLGLPLGAPGDAALVHVYGLRALFIALLGQSHHRLNDLVSAFGMLGKGHGDLAQIMINKEAASNIA